MPQAERVRYIHIPKHAVKDFRDFARDVAAQACRDVATNNPYVQALNKHRAELQSPLAAYSDPDFTPEQPTLEQLLSTQREALSTISSATGRPGGGGAAFFYGSCGQDAEQLRRCGLFGNSASFTAVQCCTNRGDTDETPIGEISNGDAACVHQEAVVYPITSNSSPQSDGGRTVKLSPTEESPGGSNASKAQILKPQCTGDQCSSDPGCKQQSAGDVAAGPPCL